MTKRTGSIYSTTLRHPRDLSKLQILRVKETKKTTIWETYKYPTIADMIMALRLMNMINFNTKMTWKEMNMTS